MSEPLSPAPPERVRPAAMLQRWSAITFLHWRVEPARVRRLVPEELEVDTFDGSAWIGLVPFRMTMRAPLLPPVPVLSTFPETNVRTYVRDASGRRGLWFLSLDVPRSAAALVGRAAFGLPYAWSRMSLEERDATITYATERLAPARGSRSSVVVSTGGGPAVDELTTFLTARFRLFGRSPLGLYRLAVEHPPWTLGTALVRSIEDDLVPLAGLAVGREPVHVCRAAGVDVRVGIPRPLGTG